MANTLRKVHNFAVTLAGVSEITDAMEDAVLGAGCDDALLWSRGGTVYLRFGREAESLGDAIGSAVKDVERAGLSVARVDVNSGRP
jgi:hypothetical protein